VKASPVEASSGMSGVSMGAMVGDAGDPAPEVARSWVCVEGGDACLVELEAGASSMNRRASHGPSAGLLARLPLSPVLSHDVTLTCVNKHWRDSLHVSSLLRRTVDVSLVLLTPRQS
jgi:hypothetical protein